jgi:N-acetylmuramoyl-L-alanine amidase/TolA-binding protein
MSRVRLMLLFVFFLLSLVYSLPVNVEASTAEAAYQRAANYYHSLERNPQHGNQREAWLEGIRDVQNIYQTHTNSSVVSACLHLMGRMYYRMYERFHQPADLHQALNLFKQLINLFPESNEAAEALYLLGQVEQTQGNLRGAARIYQRLIQNYPFSTKKADAERQLQVLRTIAKSLASRKAPAPVLAESAKQKPAAVTPPRPAPAPTVQAEVKPATPTVTPPRPAPAPTIQAEVKPATPAVTSPRPAPAPTIQAEVKPATPAVTPPRPAPAPTVQAEVKPATPAVTPPRPAPAPTVQAEVKPATPAVTPPRPAPAPTVQAEVKPATPAVTPPRPAPAPPQQRPPIQAEVKPATPAVPSPPVALVQEQASSSKIMLSELKIAELDPQEEKKTPLQPVQKVTEQEEKPQPSPPPLAQVLPIQHWSSDDYSRVALSISRPVAYKVQRSEKEEEAGFLYIDFQQSQVAADERQPIRLDQGLVKQIQAQQLSPTHARVRLELDARADTKIFTLQDPFRVVVDLRRLPPPAPVLSESPHEPEKEQQILAPDTKKTPVRPSLSRTPEELTLAQQLGLGVRRIVIDPGHGGKDTGATGFGLEEKHVVLNVAQKIKDFMEKEHNYEVLLTRDQDVFLPLEARTAFANTKGADLFVSIHVNAHPNARVKGVETFFLNLATNPEAMRVAALENATSTHSISEMQDILSGILQNTKIAESSLLAEFIQNSMIKGLRQAKYTVKDLGVKQAPFYVLIGAQMPAVLAEIAFISNAEEAKRLQDERYLQVIAEQIAAGLIAYIEHLKTAALRL